ncbi:hypothetical protein J2Z21_007770 [Streptomyces griseochromogenes]|uniref:DUF8175 domain-containing protein n=1 Tax=Streptomyces griseochromogenes TaxID=68214 RepID=A0A1B1BAT6_9ACTN|nr:hypothetical protein [Streptomyces griseochromogenes]ANP55943.1 hypothetical protein AVL59_45705 [Streptomyces griseochromogenes]MBP2054760.1 hypothetical protein [Streptomyces griseochromogenes]
MSPTDEQGYTESGQTRTRLPGGDPYGGAPRRGGRSSSRSLVTVVGVVVILVAAIAFANRGDDSSAKDSTAKGDRPHTSSTAASGSKPVETKIGNTPSGFAHTAQGAQSAAANYAVALGSAEMFNKAQREFILQSIVTPSKVTSSEAAMDRAYTPAFNQSLGLSTDGAAPKGYAFVSRTSPIGTKVTESTSDTATVAVWCSGLLGLAGDKSTNPVTNSWFTITMKLEWTGGDWKIITHSQQEGPAPVPGDDKASGSDEISKAVDEYGGFTYAR